MTNNVALRIIFNVVIAVCVFQSWWLAAFAVAVAATWIFPYFIEIIIAGIVFDALFGMVPDMGIWGYISTIEAIGAFIILAGLRGYIRK